MDPFEVIGQVPADRSYQWWAIDNPEPGMPSLEEMLRDGWSFVEPQSHPMMAGRRGRIEYGGQVLIQKERHV